jgi:hypothetical protein
MLVLVGVPVAKSGYVQFLSDSLQIYRFWGIVGLIKVKQFCRDAKVQKPIPEPVPSSSSFRRKQEEEEMLQEFQGWRPL